MTKSLFSADYDNKCWYFYIGVNIRILPGVFSGIMYAFATLGPALGYIIGGQLLNIYVDFDSISTAE